MGLQLPHNEMWDDSALVDSWNEALHEYEKYHSIHRNGGNVEDILKSNQATADGQSEAAEEPNPSAHKTAPEMRGDTTTDGRRENGTATTQHSLPLNGGPGPQGLLSSVQDEGLKRLLMSWYYAGYYTGLYEGQKDQTQRDQPEQIPN
ncbi:hypothetical protein GGR52DRAFT_31747 [Hypoxylon sp. FL1284]|nr:hypothetical protein GGR52DRAFT_31747 [Hypoxylon sp. FL1284]